jgi:2-methylcitrate dehydratase
MSIVRLRTRGSIAARDDHRQLAWALAEIAAEPVPVPADVAAAIGDRLIDNASRAAVALAREATVCARAQAAFHPARSGATIYGLSAHRRFSPEWAAWANGIAVRDARRHDPFIAGSPPLDLIGPILAVAQHCERTGGDLVRGIAAAAEIQVALTRGIGASAHDVDPAVHLAPAVAAGIGALLALPVETIDRAIRAALSVAAMRPPPGANPVRARASAPALASKAAIEAVDGAMRGEAAPLPSCGGEDGNFTWMLCNDVGACEVVLPARGALRTAVRGMDPARKLARGSDAAAFRSRTDEIIPDFEQDRFLNTVVRLPRLSADDLSGLTFVVPPGELPPSRRPGLFEGRARISPFQPSPAPVLGLVELA